VQTNAERTLTHFLKVSGLSGRALDPVVFARVYQRLRRAAIQEIRPLQVYLAGPNVFFDPADRIFERQKEILADVGLRGISPEDLQADLRDKATPHEVAMAIGEADYHAMGICELAIANLHPWPIHPDPSVKLPVEPDAGTAVEIGAMEQQGKVVYGYLGLARERTVFERYKTYLDHDVHQDEKGLWRDCNQVMFDATDGPGNLMLGTAIERSGGVVAWHDAPPASSYLDLTAFREVARVAAEAHVAPRWRRRTKRLTIR
jgi:nucleoside 2-deoxyribosyltransferase